MISIGNSAFYNCSGLTSVTIPNSVTSIGEYAFYSCSGLTSITIPNSVTNIGKNVFSDCSGLTSVTIPNSVTSIGDNAFSLCFSLTSITIPNSVTSIGYMAFYGCRSTSVTVERETPLPISSDTFTNRSNSTLYVPAGCVDAYEAAQYWQDFGTIVEMAPPSPVINFADQNLKDICVANWDTNGDGELSEDEAADVTTLGEVFKGNSNITSFDELQYFTGLTEIGDEAFRSCSGLTSVTIPNSVTNFGFRAFGSCSGLTSVTIPNSVTSIGDAFYNCSGLTSVIIPNSVTSIGDNAFSRCSGLTSITIPNSVTSIGDYAFSYCDGLTSVTIPNSVTSIGHATFSYCDGLTSVTIPNSVTSIGHQAFSACSGLTSITIPNSVTSIGSEAFSSCSGLTSVTIPSSVTSIGEAAFSECSSLTSIVVDEGNLVYDSRDNCNAIIKTEDNELIVGCRNTVIPNSVTSIGGWAFQRCTGLTSITIPNSVTSIGEYAFYRCEGLISITIPNSVASIGRHAFHRCSGLTSVTIPNSVTTTGEYAFQGCTGLTSITIPNNVTCIDDGTFSNCSGLTSVTIPNTVTRIGSSAFDGCSSLTSIIIPNSVTTIENSTFARCTGLTSVTIPNNVTTIGDGAFLECSGLTSINIPSSVTSIGGSAFFRCSSLTSVTIPSSVTSIGRSAFLECSGLTSVTIPNSVTSIGEYAFSNCSGLTSVTVEIDTPLPITSTTFTNRSNATLYVPSGSREAYMEAAYWQDFNIEELSSATNDENVIAEKDWSAPYWFESSEETGATYEMTADGVAINNPQVQENYWTPQTLVLDNATLEENHSYKVVINAKIPSDGQLQINMGSWGFAQQYDFPVTGSDEFQDVEVVFDDFPSNEEGVHVLFQNGGIAGTSVVRNVKIIDLTDNENVVAEHDWASPYWTGDYDDIGATYEMTSDGVAINNPQVQEHYWMPQTSVLDYATLEENHSYKVVINAKIPSDGQLQVNMGNWEFSQQYDIPVTGSDEFQDIEVLFDEYPESIDNVHVLFQNGGIAGTCVVRNVKIIDLGDIPADLMYCYYSVIMNNVKELTATVIKNPDRLYKEAVTIPATVIYEGEEYTVTAIADDAFTDCTKLTSISIPATMTSISGSSFANCAALQQIVVDPSNTVYDSRSDCNAIIETATNHLIAGCHQTVIPDDVTEIGNNAFWGRWGMETMNIPESVTSIGAYAFAYSISLNKIIIPAGVESIGEGAFAECNALTAVHVGNPVPVEIEENTFSNRSNATLYVPSGSVAAYKEAAYWQEFKEIVPMVNIIVNSDLEDSDYSSFSNEWQDGADLIQDGVGSNDSRGLVIQSVDNPTDPWDTQLWINLPCGLPAGTKYHLSFDYKASQDATGSMIFQEGLGGDIADYFTNVDFTTDWRHFDLCGTYDSESLGEDLGDRLARYICLHLSQFETATTFYLDNIVFEIKPFAYVAEAPWGRDLKSTGEAQELVEGGSAINGTFQYSLDGENYSEEIPTATKAGWYTVYYKVVSNNPEVDDSKPAEIGLFIKSRFEELNNLIQQAQVVGINTEEAEAVNNDEATYDQVEEALVNLRADYISKLAEGIDSDLLPLDVTSVIDNPRYIMDLPNGWITDENEGFWIGWACANTDNVFNTRQTITGLPNGTYKLKVKGFHRPGNQNDVYADYMQGTNNAKARIFANEESVTLKNIASEARDSKIDDWSGIEVTFNEQTQYVPITLEDARTWFDAGYYENELMVTVTDGTLALGACLDESVDESWVVLSDFRLEYTTNYIYMDNTEVLSGTDNTLSIKMKNCIPMEGFEFDLYLPEGITVAVDADGFPEACLSTERTNERKTNSFDAAFQEDGSLRVLAASTNGSTISGTDGEIVTVKVNVDGNLPEGDYTLLLKNISLSEGSNAVSHRTDQVKGKLTIVNGLLGDANRDTYVDVADFTATAHHILGNTPESFNAKAANANEDDIIDVGDLTAIAHLILYGSVVIPDNSSPAKPWLTRGTLDEGQNPENYVYINPVSVKPGNEITLSVNMKNVVEAEGFGFDLYLPEGMTFATDEDGFVEARLSTERTTAKKTNSFDAVIQPDGALRILAASTNGSTISGNDGEVALITINIDPAIAAGEYSLQLKNIAISDVDAVSHRTDLLESMIIIVDNGITTGIEGAEGENTTDQWYSLDGKKLNSKPKAAGIYIKNGKKVVIK